MFNWFDTFFDGLQSGIFENVVQPLAFRFGLMAYSELAYDGVAWFLYGALQIVLLCVFVRPLESLWPAEEWADRKGTRLDAFYTIIARTGLLPLLYFLAMRPLTASIDGWLRLHGWILPNLEDLAPGLAQWPLVSFFIYLILLDAAGYAIHRLQHSIECFWQLHAVHHSQQKMSLWTDERNHLVEGAISWFWFATIALAIGVPPGQFVLLATAARIVESFSHANIRLSFGKWGERILVSPHFHRLHHAAGVGHEGRYRGCNFAVLFPVWDILFRTANFDPGFPATGIRDQWDGAEYGETFGRQQWQALLRSARVLAGKPAFKRQQP
jgi:sterol desaturase/sphingolipid hydroxylase (fatty acid hydroxylase superfamily)